MEWVAIPEELPSRGISHTSDLGDAKSGQNHLCAGPNAAVCKDTKEADMTLWLKSKSIVQSLCRDVRSRALTAVLPSADVTGPLPFAPSKNTIGISAWISAF